MPTDKQKFTENAGKIIDHLVDCVGEPSISLARVLVLVDIAAHMDTTQVEIGNRLDIDKSSIVRSVDWLVNYGCITKHISTEDARENNLRISAYSEKQLSFALSYVNNSHEYLQNFLQSFIKSFDAHKPSLRDAKVLLTVGTHETASKSDILDNLYNGPASTDNRAICALIEEGLIEKNG